MLRPDVTLVIASHNGGKVRELTELLAPYSIECVSAANLGLSEPDETGDSFAGNAKLKATAAAKGSGMLALSDDSGLEVEALGGAPGIYSARWSGANKAFDMAMTRVHHELKKLGTSDRRANFTCALALASPDGGVETFTGQVFGTIVWPPRGERGFGYDPIFVPDGYGETFGEMDPELKNRLSHRMRAFEKLLSATYVDE